MALERCLKCHSFIEESSLRCPECGFEYPALEQEAPTPRKRPDSAGIPDFMRRENWEAAAPLKTRFDRTPLGMIFFLAAAVGALYATYRAWTMMHAPQEGFIEVKVLPTTGPRPRGAGAIPSPPAELPASGWVFHGTALDLVTLKPAAGVSIRFEDLRRNRVYETTTFKNGHYRAELPEPAGTGYFIRIEDPRYAPNQAGLARSEAAAMTRPAREATARRMAETIVPGNVARPPSGGGPLDLLLIPKK